ncbi:SAP30-binding protein [Apis laboriosa]|uniref:SAP30-binding protein n=2 Tax=Apis TaxID=7459 RepID=A0A7M7M4E7_APIME|nr:SAP30-binding protein [Apis mellifera]XP_006622138.1 SAP30-binding protein [Apis dorsata]XP_006622139.1 SAP30-binding protein [Apis dorsata]XP_006622140.1 SAP30-binding protein [Apis dorsata]XP_012346211.1 SAP30-binding protein [Apis florea]XP_012346212.1 SAP30-binding protein [Apis florea]XP_016767854.1 SAP30-binding protein [Apis mellifera]XP_016913501.1 SAP30-binding protein [Apis cerana]XP_026296437.1 SAP30-binding protein [Apis mellifera]XP_028523021.1 SAP30-binding protein [Apis c|eukprot:XP_006570306.1 SAP30-binding protein [Apis mellifera]
MSVQSVALASLTATYTDSEGEDGVEDDLQENSNTPQGAAPHNAQVGQPQAFTSPKSGTSASNSPVVAPNVGGKSSNDLSNAPTLVTDVTSKVQRLVSYFDDSIVSDDEGVVQTQIDGQPFENGRPSSIMECSPCCQGEQLVSDSEVDSYGVTIPPEPPGQCPVELQEKITKLFRKMESSGLDMNKVIQQRKDFRNPSIYEKLIQFCSINELGTNYPPDRFDPFKWGKDSYYEELAKVQKTEMDKLEKARKEKTKIEIVSGTAKRPNNSSTTDDDAKKRKSKWDQVATGATASIKPTVLLSQPTLTTLTSSATGTKATVISAFGSLPKKRL